MTHYNFKLCTQSDESTIIDFLMTVKDELYLPDRRGRRRYGELDLRQGWHRRRI